MPLPRREKADAERSDWWPKSLFVPSQVDGDCEVCGEQVYVGDPIVARSTDLIHQSCGSADV